MVCKKHFLILIILTVLSSCNKNEVNLYKELSTFETLHSISESFYTGDGSWGKGYAYKMALRDAYWRADVYLELSNVESLYASRSHEVYSYLQTAQTEGGTGVFGFHADIDNPEFGSTVKNIIAQCPECINNGWVISLPDEHIAELYYDHGYSLVSIAKSYIRNHDSNYLWSIITAADWALDKPLHSNINYLSALSKGLSYAYKATGDERYLDRAIYLHEYGILPYLSSENGAALDSHNQQLEYHGFITSGIIALKMVMPADHEFRFQVDEFMALSVLHMQQRNITEDGSYGVTWPGINLLSWYELEQIRSLTLNEKEAKDRCILLINGYKKHIIEESGFRLQKSIYSNYFIGLYDN